MTNNATRTLTSLLTLPLDWPSERHLASSLVATLKSESRKRKAVRKTSRSDPYTGEELESWNFAEYLFKKKGALPTGARGLFTAEVREGAHQYADTRMSLGLILI